MTSSLAGIRILDLSRVLAGPWATQLLGDYGADVIKVERPRAGDETRAWGPPWATAGGDAAYFHAANRNKRSLTVDLSVPAGQELVRALAGKADVLVENFRVGTLRRFGLDYARLREQNPALIYCSISAFGQEGSRSGEPGYDAMIQAGGGMMSITGEHDGPPVKAGVAIADIVSGMYAASAILAALHARGVSGRGQHIDVSLYGSQVALLANQAMNYLIGGKSPARMGSAHPNIVPYQVFATGDGHLMLAVGNDEQFSRLARTLERDELARDPRFQNNAARVQHRDELVAALAGEFVGRSTAEWLDKLGIAGVPCGPIRDIQEVFEDEFAAESGLVQQIDNADGDTFPTVANPAKLSDTPVRYAHAPPGLGEHTVDILEEWLGLTRDDIADLEAQGAI